MPGPRSLLVGVLSGLAFAAAVAHPAGQLPLATPARSGRTVTPVFEGWYPNPDGTFSISFGYYNRNLEEAVDIPIGPENSIEPGDRNQGQPTRFEPQRHWGVFAVKVPKDFGDGTITWTLTFRGETYAIPGHLRPNWQIDALEGEAGSGNTPPALKLDAGGPEGSGPLGVTGAAQRATIAQPLSITVWARDDGKPSSGVTGSGRGAVPVTLTWFKHQGPGRVTFNPSTARVPVTGGSATTAATFSEPGTYVLRVRANDASGVSGAGHAQCCWTNAFVPVTVMR